MERGEEAALVDAARRGDDVAFQRLVRLHQSALRAHCYRLLGSAADADDALQQTLLSAFQGLHGFEGRSSLRTWLFTIATHACMRFASRRPSERLSPMDRAPPADPRAPIPEVVNEPIWLSPFRDEEPFDDAVMSPEARYSECESIEIAFVAALQILPATQRAVLVLRDVLGFSAQETALALDTSIASANSALQRARETVARRVPETQATNRRGLGHEAHRALVERFVGAWLRADVDGIVAMLADDATFTMPPLPCWFSGREALRTFLAEVVFEYRWRFRETRANGQPALAAYRLDEATSTYRLEVLNLFDLRGHRVSAIHAFVDVDARDLALPSVFA